eukprot:181429-Amphidinium_carterae.3
MRTVYLGISHRPFWGPSPFWADAPPCPSPYQMAHPQRACHIPFSRYWTRNWTDRLPISLLKVPGLGNRGLVLRTGRCYIAVSRAASLACPFHEMNVLQPLHCIAI